jgi:hypothetical protein
LLRAPTDLRPSFALRLLPVALVGRVEGVSTLAFIVAGVLLYNATRPAPPRPLIRLNAEIAPDTPLARVDSGTGGNMLALSPDGARLALTLRGADGKVHEFKRIAGTETLSDPDREKLTSGGLYLRITGRSRSKDNLRLSLKPTAQN